jgi:hypothetical protein
MVRDALRDFSGAVEMTRSGFEHRHRREPLEPVGAGREHVGHAVPPAVAGAGVMDGECAIFDEVFPGCEQRSSSAAQRRDYFHQSSQCCVLSATRSVQPSGTISPRWTVMPTPIGACPDRGYLRLTTQPPHEVVPSAGKVRRSARACARSGGSQRAASIIDRRHQPRIPDVVHPPNRHVREYRTPGSRSPLSWRTPSLPVQGGRRGPATARLGPERSRRRPAAARRGRTAPAPGASTPAMRGSCETPPISSVRPAMDSRARAGDE